MQCSEYGQRKGLSIAPGGLVIQAFISSTYLMESNNWQKFYREGWNWEKQLYSYSDRQAQIMTLKGARIPATTNIADSYSIPPKFPFSRVLAINPTDGSDGKSNYKLLPISSHYIPTGKQRQTILLWLLILEKRVNRYSCILYL